MRKSQNFTTTLTRPKIGSFYLHNTLENQILTKKIKGNQDEELEKAINYLLKIC